MKVEINKVVILINNALPIFFINSILSPSNIMILNK